MDEFRKNTEQDASEQTTPFQTPVRGADEQPGAGYQNTGASYTHTNDTADSSGFSDAGNGGSTPPPHSNAYEQWSGGKKPSGPKGPKGPKKKFPWRASRYSGLSVWEIQQTKSISWIHSRRTAILMP